MQDQFDIVIVTFDKEIPMLELQAKSIAKFVDLNIGNIIIIYNCPDSRFLYVDMDWFGKYKDRVKIFRRNDLYDAPANLTGYWLESKGYVLQQILKIKSYRLCFSPYIIILDAKNWFINTVTEDKILSADKKLLYQSVGVADHWKSYIHYIENKLDLPLNTINTSHINNLTPFFVTREVLSQIDKDVDDYEDDLLKGNYPEFMLINAYIEKHYKLSNFFFDDNYQELGYVSGLWANWNTDPNYSDHPIDSMFDCYYKYEFLIATGINRTQWQTLDVKHQQELIKKLKELDLMNEIDSQHLIDNMIRLNSE